MNNYKDIKLFFAKTKPDAIIPTKNLEDAGRDVYACFEEDYLIIPPHTTVMIPTGIASSFSVEFYGQLFERGSTGTKGMIQHSGVIDSGFRGEWVVPIGNGNEYPMVIIKKDSKTTKGELLVKLAVMGYTEPPAFYPYEKAICQVVFLPVPQLEQHEISLEQLKAIPSKRGAGKLGSSGK